MAENDQIAELVFNGAANLTLWLLGLVFFWAVEPRRSNAIRRHA